MAKQRAWPQKHEPEKTKNVVRTGIPKSSVPDSASGNKQTWQTKGYKKTPRK